MGKNLDLTGQRFGRLQVGRFAHKGVRNRKHWLCWCDCGGAKVVETNALRSGKVQSCGCKHMERVATMNRSHGMSGTKTYKIWCGVKARCEIPSATGYPQYGGRGIRLCARWQKFENFLEDMGECPDGMSIERKDVNADYEARNCRWAPLVDQPRNTTRSRWVDVNNVKRLARDVAVENGVTVAAFKARLYKYGWTLERACGLEGVTTST